MGGYGSGLRANQGLCNRLARRPLRPGHRCPRGGVERGARGRGSGWPCPLATPRVPGARGSAAPARPGAMAVQADAASRLPSWPKEPPAQFVALRAALSPCPGFGTRAGIAFHGRPARPENDRDAGNPCRARAGSRYRRRPVRRIAAHPRHSYKPALACFTSDRAPRPQAFRRLNQRHRARLSAHPAS
jgi:hypothetical protein